MSEKDDLANWGGSRKTALGTMPMISNERTATHYRLQAAHLREFLETVHDDDQLRCILLDAAVRLDRLAEQAEANRRPLRAKRKARSGGRIILVDSFSPVEGV
jgi:hypothetical protein